jgi:hypothetical protein
MAYFPPNDLIASGTINTQNLNATGAATAGSAVAIANLNGQALVNINVTANTLNQNLTPQVSVDGTNWYFMNPLNIQTGTYATIITAGQTGTWQISTAGYTQVRLVEQSAVTGSATVNLRASFATNLANVNLANMGSTPLQGGQGSVGASMPVALANEDVQDLFITGQSAQTATVNNILPAASGASATDTIQLANGAASVSYRSGSVQVTSTGTGGTYIFECSNDNVNFRTLTVYDQSISTGTSVTAAITATASQLIYVFPIVARYIRLRIATTITGGSIQAFSRFSQVEFAFPVAQVAQATAANLNVTAAIAAAQTLSTVTTVGTVTTVSTLTGTTSLTPGTAATNLGKAKGNAAGATDTGVASLLQRTDALAVQGSTGQYVLAQSDKVGAQVVNEVQRLHKTYSASGVIVPAASATDIAILPGNGTTTVYVTKVIISGIQTTGGAVQFFLAKRSTANTGGTSTSFTVVPHDSGDAAASSTPLNYTANPTSTGTLVGNVRTAYVALGASTVTTNDVIEFSFGVGGKPIILSGTTQGLAVNLNAVTVTGGSIDVTYEWYEL